MQFSHIDVGVLFAILVQSAVLFVWGGKMAAKVEYHSQILERLLRAQEHILSRIATHEAHLVHLLQARGVAAPPPNEPVS